MRRQKNDFPVKPLSFTFIILLVFCFGLVYIWRILTSADYFQVKDIVGKDALRVDLSYLKGKNIFSLDLTREAVSIARVCPDCSRVRLARIIPNRIYVELIKRKPVAFLKLYRYFAVDENGVIFSSSLQPASPDLPIITGLETKVFGPKPGMRCDQKELLSALLILKEAARTPLLKDYRIERIKLSGIDNITVQIPLTREQITYVDWKVPEKSNFLEIKFSPAKIRDKVMIMAGLINQEKRNLKNIKYIDLRFNEPVIKFREDKTQK